MIKAVLWDNDGVLVDTEHLYFLATREVMLTIGVEITEEIYRNIFLKEGIGPWHFAREKGLGENEIDNLKKRRNQVYTGLLSGKNYAIEGAEDTLMKLKPHYIIGVVTSARREHFEMVHKVTDFLKYFDFVLTIEDYEKSKPDPQPYLEALKKSGVASHEALVIEDSQRGLTSAKAAGLTCWVIPTGLTMVSDFSRADKILSNIHEVASLLLAK
ncbi:MAG: HAD family phosphatase [Deltaproteobacteria bacterium]|nr:HAD family phosphatase [Deltaproteobacteria bacterium]